MSYSPDKLGGKGAAIYGQNIDKIYLFCYNDYTNADYEQGAGNVFGDVGIFGLDYGIDGCKRSGFSVSERE